MYTIQTHSHNNLYEEETPIGCLPGTVKYFSKAGSYDYLMGVYVGIWNFLLPPPSTPERGEAQLDA